MCWLTLCSALGWVIIPWGEGLTTKSESPSPAWLKVLLSTTHERGPHVICHSALGKTSVWQLDPSWLRQLPQHWRTKNKCFCFPEISIFPYVYCLQNEIPLPSEISYLLCHVSEFWQTWCNHQSRCSMVPRTIHRPSLFTVSILDHSSDCPATTGHRGLEPGPFHSA